MTTLKACAWARTILREGEFVVIDTETTGLDDEAKIVSIAVVGEQGNTLYYSLINPGVPIPPDSTAIHGITDHMVADAPTFAQAWSSIRAALRCRRWLIYNWNYDYARIHYECQRYGLLVPVEGHGEEDFIARCIMERYAEFHGAWSDYHESYKWQKLRVAAERCGVDISNHHALSDALAAWGVLRYMALSEDRTEGDQS